MMRRLSKLFHPIFVFIGVQIAWVILMVVWVNWYIKNNRDVRAFAQRIRPDLFTTDVSWVVLMEGCFLMLIILAGVYMIFVYWNKQNRLNQMQSNFISSVSHELKSPLASIQLYLETLKYRKVPEEEVKDFVETMLTDTERLSGLIENILEASKPDTKSMQFRFLPVEMGPLLQEVVESHKRRFEEKDFKIDMEIVDAPTLNIDKRTMRMVFTNLVGNALRYSNTGSTLTVRMRNKGKYCEIQFIDAGIGIEKKELKKIFRKFYRIHNKETYNIEGAGLGLSISQEIVKNHRGKLSVASEGIGKGCVFTILLPLKFKSADTAKN